MPKQQLKEQTGQIAQASQPRPRTRATTTTRPAHEEPLAQTQPPQQTLRSASLNGGNARTIDTSQSQQYQPQALLIPTSGYRNGTMSRQEVEDDEYEVETTDDQIDEDKLYSTRSTKSVVRWQHPQQQAIPYVKTQRTLVPQRAGRLTPNTEQQRRVKPNKREYHPLLGVGIALLCVCIGIALALYIPPKVQQVRDQLTYGYPRTYQVNANVGHSSPTSPLSHFIAWNDNGTIKVQDIPEGDPTTYKSHIYIITTFTGPNADLIPVTISFASLRHNGKQDLLVFCNGTEFIWYNNGQTFSPQAS